MLNGASSGADPERVQRPLAPVISVVIPCYNEEEVVGVLCARLFNVMTSLEMPFELIFVNDGSKDGTLNMLLDLAKLYQEVKVIDFSRNFGHQIAITAGMEHAVGDVVVLIDADLQDPPELIGEFLDKWIDGYDVVYAVRKERDGETWFKKFTAETFYKLLNRFTDGRIPADTGDFRLMDRRVVNSLLTIQEKHRFVRGLVSWVGYRQIGVYYERNPRFAGKSKYPLKQMIKFSADGITSFSIKPLQLASQLGFLTAGVGFMGALLTLFLKTFTRVTIQGWTSLIMAMLFLGGVQLIILGIMGEYIGRIYDEVRNRPLYIVQERYNFKNQEEHTRQTLHNSMQRSGVSSGE